MRTSLQISLKNTLTGILLSGSFFMNSQEIALVKKTGESDVFLSTPHASENHTAARPFTIELSAFSAIPVEGQVNISWATESERNNEYFFVERSVNGLNWEVMTTLKGAGNSSIEQHYNCVDPSPYKDEISYYRLKQIYFNGEYTYSDMVTVEMESQAEKIKLYPNPAVSYIKIITDSKTTNNETVSFYNAAGHLAKQITGNISTMLIDVTDLEAGNYFAVIDSGTKTSRVQFVKN